MTHGWRGSRRPWPGWWPRGAADAWGTADAALVFAGGFVQGVRLSQWLRVEALYDLLNSLGYVTGEWYYDAKPLLPREIAEITEESAC